MAAMSKALALNAPASARNIFLGNNKMSDYVAKVED